MDAYRNDHWWDLAAPSGNDFQVAPVTLGSVQNNGVTVPPHASLVGSSVNGL